MKIGQLLSGAGQGVEGIRAAMATARQARDAANARIAELSGRRAAALLADADGEIDQLERELVQAHRDADRGDLAVLELTSRLAAAEASARQLALDMLHSRGESAHTRGRSLVAKDYRRLVEQLSRVLTELQAIDAEVREINHQLEAGGDPRRVGDVDTAARPEPHLPNRFPRQPLYQAVRLPDPAHPYNMAWPADCDQWGFSQKAAA